MNINNHSFVLHTVVEGYKTCTAAGNAKISIPKFHSSSSPNIFSVDLRKRTGANLSECARRSIPSPSKLCPCFTNTPCRIFTRWIHEIDTKNLGNVPSGGPNFYCLTPHTWMQKDIGFLFRLFSQFQTFRCAKTLSGKARCGLTATWTG